MKGNINEQYKDTISYRFWGNPKPWHLSWTENADFGQGFYLSDNEEFSRRWARERKGLDTFLNRYELVTDGLKIKQLSRDEEWFAYIFANRAGREDSLSSYDVIIGPIANDTIYDTWGILTSGLISTEQALGVLMCGASYEQVVLKTPKAAEVLRFVSSDILSHEEISQYRDIIRQEEKLFQEQLTKRIGHLSLFQ